MKSRQWDTKEGVDVCLRVGETTRRGSSSGILKEGLVVRRQTKETEDGGARSEGR